MSVSIRRTDSPLPKDRADRQRRDALDRFQSVGRILRFPKGLPQPRLVPVGTEPLVQLYEMGSYDPNDPKNVNFGVALATFAKLLQDYPNEPDSTTKSE